MPRRNRDLRAGARLSQVRSAETGAVGWARTEVAADGEWVVRSVPGARGLKTYRCPGCDHEIAPGIGHVVAWPAGVDERVGSDQRRHWHTPCWSARLRRRAGRRRS